MIPAVIRLFSFNLSLWYVFIWVKAEEVTSHRNLDPKDKGSLGPYFPKSGHCNSVLSVCLILSPQSEDTSINCSCSQGSLLLSGLLKGFLIRSSLTDVLSISLKYQSSVHRGARRHTFPQLSLQWLCLSPLVSSNKKQLSVRLVHVDSQA